jgi:hypothetical protein
LWGFNFTFGYQSAVEIVLPTALVESVIDTFQRQSGRTRLPDHTISICWPSSTQLRPVAFVFGSLFRRSDDWLFLASNFVVVYNIHIWARSE